MTMLPCTTYIMPMRFVRIILSSILRTGKMKIPSMFVKYHGDELGECVSLSVPSGRSWTVRIRRENGSSILLHDGLLKFMEDNSVGIGFHILFEYRGGSKFSVFICNLTATEIQYNCTNASETSDVNQMQNGDSQKKARGGDDSIEPSKCASTHNRQKRLLHETYSIKQGYYLTRSKKQTLDRGIAVDGSGGKSLLKSLVKYETGGNSTSPKECVDERTIQVENKSFPPSFKVTIKVHNIENGYLDVPRGFTRLNMPQSTKLIKLVDSDDNECVVRFLFNTKRCQLSAGWPRFVKDKKLMAGDVCIFERIGGNQVKLKVVISRFADDKKSKMYRDATRFDGCDATASDIVRPSSTGPSMPYFPSNLNEDDIRVPPFSASMQAHLIQVMQDEAMSLNDLIKMLSVRKDVIVHELEKLLSPGSFGV